jgi:hypothetical protein
MEMGSSVLGHFYDPIWDSMKSVAGKPNIFQTVFTRLSGRVTSPGVSRPGQVAPESESPFSTGFEFEGFSLDAKAPDHKHAGSALKSRARSRTQR